MVEGQLHETDKGDGPVSDDLGRNDSDEFRMPDCHKQFLFILLAEFSAASGAELHPIDNTRKVTLLAEETPHPSLLKGQ
jgi:hypothetical protein